MSRPVVHLYTVCWDEADMLGFFFRHYDPWVDRYIVFDDGSTDGSLDILAAHSKVELRRLERSDPQSFCLSHQAMQDHSWKASRGSADWVVVTAIDEHLHVRGRCMADYLAEQARRGVTIVPALGFDMNHPTMPDDAGLLTTRMTRGRPRLNFNKLSIFKPEAVQESGFAPGRHLAQPVGDLRLPARDEVMLWHYKHLGFERNAAREAGQAARLGPVDLERRLGEHYLWSKQRLRAFWDEMESHSADLADAAFAPELCCARPLWWEAEAEIPRVSERRAAASPSRVPTVSVLIKTYNHARYVRQALDSILSQSFQDFEVVVTDDGSNDATPEILRSYDDPRICLRILPENVGISSAMNATVARARGRYFAILNSDDWAHPERLERQVRVLDAQPGAAAVFTLPRCVGENGEAAGDIGPFRAPLLFSDLSRRSWLRHFFFSGNCLCAPTAMIRREAYETVGAYDPRLVNLGDLDMWIRMLVAGFDFSFLGEELTCFRVRTGLANMSAPRPDTIVRSAFELTKILKRLGSLDEAMFADVFGDDASHPDVPGSTPVRLSRLAALDPRPEYQILALECLYDGAMRREEFHELIALSGRVDPFKLLTCRGGERASDRSQRDGMPTACLPDIRPPDVCPPDLQACRALSLVTKLYRIVLGRAPDGAGLQSFSQRILNGSMTTRALIEHLASSAEFQGQCRSADAVNLVVRNAADRSPSRRERASTLTSVVVGLLTDPALAARHPVLATLYPDGLPPDQPHLQAWLVEETGGAVPSGSVS